MLSRVYLNIYIYIYSLHASFLKPYGISAVVDEQCDAKLCVASLFLPLASVDLRKPSVIISRTVADKEAVFFAIDSGQMKMAEKVFQTNMVCAKPMSKLMTCLIFGRNTAAAAKW